MSSLTTPFTPTMKILDPDFTSSPFNEDAPWFMCKGRVSETYLGSESFKKFHIGQTPHQRQIAIKPLDNIKIVHKCFILIKHFTVDNARAFESQDTSAFVRKLRKSLCTAFSYVLTHLQEHQPQLSIKSIHGHGLDKDTSNLLTSIVRELDFLLATVGSISDICNVRCLREFSDISQSDVFYYHYVHASLDIWYNSIAILQIINTIPFGLARNETFTDNAQLDPFMKVITTFLNDFTYLAINYYHSFRNSAPFPCECFQEFWIMLINILDKEPSSEECSFWFVYSKAILQLLNSSLNPKTTDILTLITDKIENKDLIESCLWLTSYIATLHKYDLCGKYCESKKPKSGYGVLKYLINKLLSFYTDSKVENIRFSLFHTLQLISLWEPNCDVILPLTDFFIKKIADMFCPPGVDIKGLSYLFKCSTTWFQYISKLSSPCTALGKESSFDIFLHIITKQLTKDLLQKSLWRLLKGRIYSKLTAKKMKELSEVGLQNSFSLLLAIAESGQMEITDKICELTQVIEGTLSPKKQIISWKVLFVLMHIHQIKGHKLNKIINKITQFFNETCISFSMITRDSMHKSNVMNLLLVYIDCMGKLFEQCHNLSLSEYQLIGSGFSTLLSTCGITEMNYILNVFSNILVKVKNIIGDNNDTENYAVEMQYTTFIEFMFTHIYPSIESISTTNTPLDQVANIAVLLMTLSCNTVLTEKSSFNYCTIFLHFATKETVSISLVCRFLCLLLDDIPLVNVLKNKVPVCQMIFQLWLKCIINLPPPCEQMEELTPKVLLQKDFVEIFPKVLDLNLRSNDYVFTSIALFRVMGETYESHSDPQLRKQLRGNMLSYFKTYVPCVLKRITTQRNGLTMTYVYKHVSHLVEHCSPLLHLKGSPDSILPRLIDKTVIPHLVFPKDKSLQTMLFFSIKEYVSNILRGLFKLDYKSDVCIQREIKDIMVNYVCNYPSNTNPITRLLIDTVNSRPEGLKPETFEFLLEIIRVNILLNSSANAMNGFTMLHDILRFTPTVKKNYVMTVLLKSTLEVLMKQSNLSKFLGDLIKKILEYFQEKDLNDSKNILVPILQWFIREKLQWATVKAFNILDTFAEHLPLVFEHVVSFLLETVKALEEHRGSGPDDVIREYLKRTLSKLPKSSNFDKKL